MYIRVSAIIYLAVYYKIAYRTSISCNASMGTRGKTVENHFCKRFENLNVPGENRKVRR